MQKYKLILWALVLVVGLNGCVAARAVDDTVTVNEIAGAGEAEIAYATLPPLTPVVGIEDWIRIYMAEPLAANADSYRGGPDVDLAAAIDGADISVDAAIHDLNLWSIRDALLDGANARLECLRLIEAGQNERNFGAVAGHAAPPATKECARSAPGGDASPFR